MTVLWPGEANPAGVRPDILKALEFCWDVHDSSSARWVGYDGYVQWAGWPEGLQIECSGSPTQPATITAEARRVLESLGFEEPNAKIPNWFRRVTVREELPAAADTLITCLFEVLAPELAPLSAPPKTAEPGHGAVITLAPVGKMGPDRVRVVAALLAQEVAFTGPALVLDAYDFTGCCPDLPGFARMRFTELAVNPVGPRPGLDRVLVQGLEQQGAAAELFAVAQVAQAVRDASRAGWTVLLIGPPVLGPYRWMYEHGALPLTHGLVILRDTFDRQNGFHDADADSLRHHSPDRWNDPLNIEVGWDDSTDPIGDQRHVLALDRFPEAGSGPRWLRDWLR